MLIGDANNRKEYDHFRSANSSAQALFCEPLFDHNRSLNDLTSYMY